MIQLLLNIWSVHRNGPYYVLRNLMKRNFKNRNMKNGCSRRICHYLQNRKRKRKEKRHLEKDLGWAERMASKINRRRVTQMTLLKMPMKRMLLINLFRRNFLISSKLFKSSKDSKRVSLKPQLMVRKIFGSSSLLSHQEVEVLY